MWRLLGLGCRFRRAIRLLPAYNAIPAMNEPEVYRELTRFSSQLPSGSNVVQLGCWLGAGTSAVLQGCAEQPLITVHCYDRWKASEKEVLKAAHSGVKISRGQDLLPIFRSNVGDYSDEVKVHRCEFENISFIPGNISFMIVDGGKGKRTFFSVMKRFSSSWIAETTVVALLDFWHFRNVSPGKMHLHLHQKQFVEANSESFRRVSSPDDTESAFFVFAGGDLRF